MKYLKYFEAMEINTYYGGMITQYSGEKITIAGGMRVPGYGKIKDKEYYRLKYTIYSNELYKEETPEEAEIGTVDLYVNDDKSIAGLIDIKIKPLFRKSGYGRLIIKDLVDTSKEGLYIFDVKKSAIKFWEKMGIQWTDTKLGKNGFIPKM